MSQEYIAFACPSCKNIVTEKLSLKEGFCIAAWDEVMEWFDVADIVPDLKRSKTVPKEKEKRRVKVSFPFFMKVKEEGWVLFMPPLSFFNGWEEYPEEIDQSALVNFRLERILSQNNQSAWIEIEVLDVVLLSKLEERFPAVTLDHLIEEIFRYSVHKIETDDWIELSWNDEGDIGGYWLIKKHNDEKGSLVVYSEWSFHYSTVYAGNISVSKEQMQQLKKIQS